MEKHGKRRTHIRCGRCGKYPLHRRTEVCASCGFGRSRKLK